ncbi:hypothetical protein [Solibacillus sp. FSL K6-1523]|uniref:hypothetical protein n=1 Tax=Solibacillus sp. FSL K6-1523 TaxID=2921471 RepID=UPI0030FB4C0E
MMKKESRSESRREWEHVEVQLLWRWDSDTNSSLNPFDLWTYYQLKDATSKIICHGITDNFKERMKDHALGRGNTKLKRFSQVSYEDNLSNRRADEL